MKLKTAPRIILGLLVVGGVLYGVNTYMDKRAAQPRTPAEPLAQQPAPAPVQDAQPVVVQQSVVQQPAAATPEAPSADRRHDAGLNALIKGGSK